MNVLIMDVDQAPAALPQRCCILPDSIRIELETVTNIQAETAVSLDKQKGVKDRRLQISTACAANEHSNQYALAVESARFGAPSRPGKQLL